jgi:hypothetical protein
VRVVCRTERLVSRRRARDLMDRRFSDPLDLGRLAAVRPRAAAVETPELSPVDGGTLPSMTTRHPSVAARDQDVAAGMEAGIVESFERLDEVLGAPS